MVEKPRGGSVGIWFIQPSLFFPIFSRRGEGGLHSLWKRKALVSFAYDRDQSVSMPESYSKFCRKKSPPVCSRRR